MQSKEFVEKISEEVEGRHKIMLRKKWKNSGQQCQKN